MDLHMNCKPWYPNPTEKFKIQRYNLFALEITAKKTLNPLKMNQVLDSLIFY